MALSATPTPSHPSWLSRDRWSATRIQVLFAAAIITFLNAGVYGAQLWVSLNSSHAGPRLLGSWNGLAAYAWILAAPAMAWMIRRFPLRRPQIVRNVALLIGGSVALYLGVANVRFVLRVLTSSVPDGQTISLNDYININVLLFPLDSLTFSGFFALTFATNYYYRHRRRVGETVELQLQAAQLRSELAQAQLAAFRGQIHPHFLFNSLNAIATLVRQQKNDRAVQMISKMSALLRLAAESTDRHEVTLAQEVDFVSKYLEIEHLRFGDKLVTEIDLSPNIGSADVPNLLLQPLVENAIKHGIARRITPGKIIISAQQVAERLIIDIINDGPEDDPGSSKDSLGIGLANTRGRLATLYGEDFEFEITSNSQGQTQVHLSLPWRVSGL